MPIDEEDISKLAALFHIHQQAVGHPKLKALGDEAMSQLEEYAKGLAPEPVEEPVPIEEASDQGQDIDQEEAKRVREEAAATAEPAKKSVWKDEVSSRRTS